MLHISKATDLGMVTFLKALPEMQNSRLMSGRPVKYTVLKNQQVAINDGVTTMQHHFQQIMPYQVELKANKNANANYHQE